MVGKKKIDYREHEPLPQGKFPHISNVASATECTGLMPSAPNSQEELESYQELSSMEIPKAPVQGREGESKQQK